MVKLNTAQKIYIAIGGTAALVGGYMEHYYADQQTPKKRSQRSPRRLGGFSKALRDSITEKQKAKLNG